MSDELKVLKIVVERLNKEQINYMLTGSMAYNFYTKPRMTRDIDIILQLKESDIQNFYTLFKDDFHIHPDSVREAVKDERIFNIIHNELIVKVDCIIYKHKNVYRSLEFQRKKNVDFDGINTWIVSQEDLIISKLWWAKDDSDSEYQLRDVRSLLQMKDELDLDYLEHWIKELKLEAIYHKVKL